MKQMVSLRLESELIDVLDKMAEDANRTRSNLIECIIVETIKSRSIPVDRMIKRIYECKTIADLDMLERASIKGHYFGADLLDLKTECVKRYQELK